MMTKSERLRQEALRYDGAIARAERLLARPKTPEMREKLADLCKELCDRYLRELMEGRSTFYHTTNNFGHQIVRAYFGEDFYEWTGDLED